MESRRLSRAELRDWLDGSELPPRVPFEEFQEHLDETWGAGQHVSIFAPTEMGKTYLIRHGLLVHWQRYPVLWLRFKPRDRTLGGFGRQVKQYPGALERMRYANRRMDSDQWERDPEHFVVVLPRYRWQAEGKRESAAWHRARRVAGEALDKAFHEGGWVVVIDEVRAFTDADEPALNLRAPMENLWQRGRDQPVTIIAGTQEPIQAPSSMYGMPRWVYLGRTLDVGRYQRIAEIGGDTEKIKATLPQLRQYEFLAVDRWSGEMWIVKVGD